MADATNLTHVIIGIYSEKLLDPSVFTNWDSGEPKTLQVEYDCGSLFPSTKIVQKVFSRTCTNDNGVVICEADKG